MPLFILHSIFWFSKVLTLGYCLQIKSNRWITLVHPTLLFSLLNKLKSFLIIIIFIYYHLVRIYNNILLLSSQNFTCSTLFLSLFYFMAAPAKVFKDYNNNENSNNNGNPELSRREIQNAIAKAVELRALHAALMRGNTPANARFPSPSPASRPVSQFSAQDYPVFTPVSTNFSSILACKNCLLLFAELGLHNSCHHGYLVQSNRALLLEYA